jgi:molybdopterin molybdotransferase
MPKSVPTSWTRIEKVLWDAVPDTARTLGPPATDKQIEDLEASIGLSVPQALKDSLRIHNGQHDPTGCASFTHCGMFLTTEQIAETWKMLTELDEGFRQQYPNWDEGDAWWDHHWIPFTGGDGDSLCISIDPRIGPRTGEVIWFAHDNPHEPGIAASFTDWLEELARRLEERDFTIEHGQIFLNIRE